MRVLVTGLAGFLGGHVARAALERRHDVRGTWHETPPDVPGVPAEQVDLRDGPRGLVRDVDAVIHCAYAKDDPLAIVDASALLARACADAGVRLVHLSTDLVFDGDPVKAPFDEDAPPNPAVPYGRSKLRSEMEVHAALPSATVVRTSLLLASPGAPPGPQERLAADPRARFFADEVRCPLPAADLATALLDLLALDRLPATLHVAGSERLTRAQLAARLTGRPLDEIPTTPRPPDRPQDTSLDSSRARALLDASHR